MNKYFEAFQTDGDRVMVLGVGETEEDAIKSGTRVGQVDGVRPINKLRYEHLSTRFESMWA